MSQERGQQLQEEAVDVTLPGRPVHAGHLHIITQTSRDILKAFRNMGFQVYEGPDIELDMYDFELLNIPPEHPARSHAGHLLRGRQAAGHPPAGREHGRPAAGGLAHAYLAQPDPHDAKAAPAPAAGGARPELPGGGHRRHSRGLLHADGGHGHR